MASARRILILDGQTNQALACVRSLGRAGYAVYVAGTGRKPLAAWSRFCRGVLRISGESINALATLRKQAVDSGISMVLPITERSCILCNHERRVWEAAGITVGCGPDEMVATAFDKGKTLGIAERCGVRIPRTISPDTLEECLEVAQTLGFPCVLKPRFSNAWDGREFLPDRGCAYLSADQDLEAVFHLNRQLGQWPLIQEMVPGQGKGVFALCDHGRAVAWFAHERLRDVRPTGSGSSLRRSIPLDARLRDPAERLLARMKWHGPAMVEFRDDGEQPPCLMEVNGRFWTSLQLAIDAGVDFPRLWVEILEGTRVPPVTSYTDGVILRWLWGDVKRFLYVVRGAPPGFTGAYPTIGQGLRELFGAQPLGTRLEIWRRDDPVPAFGEVVQGIGEVLSRLA